MSKIFCLKNSCNFLQLNVILSIFIFLAFLRILFHVLPPYTEIHDIKQPKDMSLIIVITPTYQRSDRLADMTRTSNTLKHIKNIHWIIVEDGPDISPNVERLLKRSKISFTYLYAETPPELRVNRKSNRCSQFIQRF